MRTILSCIFIGLSQKNQSPSENVGFPKKYKINKMLKEINDIFNIVEIE
jgi:uncharacterized protein YecE (DUF72 family)